MQWIGNDSLPLLTRQHEQSKQARKTKHRCIGCTFASITGERLRRLPQPGNHLTILHPDDWTKFKFSASIQIDLFLNFSTCEPLITRHWLKLRWGCQLCEHHYLQQQSHHYHRTHQLWIWLPLFDTRFLPNCWLISSISIDQKQFNQLFIFKINQ